jgi:hypothetical protein
VEIQNSCLLISRESTCSYEGAAFDLTKEQVLLCAWDNKTKKCESKNEGGKNNSPLIATIIVLVIIITAVTVGVVIMVVIFYRRRIKAR